MNARLKAAVLSVVSVLLLVGCQGVNRSPGSVPLMGDTRDLVNDKATYQSQSLAAGKAAARGSCFVGLNVPDFTLQDQNDRPFMLSGLRGNWVVLHFFPEDDMPACGCDVTRFTMCLTELGNMQDARVYGITTASPMSLRTYVQGHELALNLLADRDHAVLERCGAWVNTPLVNGRYGHVGRSTMIIDPEGVVRYHCTQVIPAGHAERLQQKLAELQGQASRTSPGHRGLPASSLGVARASE